MTDLPPPPRVFVSYSHDSQEHKDWVLTLSHRLVTQGVDVILDQWNLKLGSDLPTFIESELRDADRVLAICTEPYVRKANAGEGGVGYEKMILTAELFNNIESRVVVPVIANNAGDQLMPTFLGQRFYADFRDPELYEQKYGELLADLHGEHVQTRPPLGENPFRKQPASIVREASFASERYVNPTAAGTVTFDYSNNNGNYIVGAGDMLFETSWSGGSRTTVHAYRRNQTIRSVALAKHKRRIDEISDASLFDTSSRVRTMRLGEIAVWQNAVGYYLATKVESLKSRSHGDDDDEITFSYRIAPRKSSSFQSA